METPEIKEVADKERKIAEKLPENFRKIADIQNSNMEYEFDEKAALEAFHADTEITPGTEFRLYVKGRKDQFEQMKAALAAKDAQLEAHKNIAADYLDRIRELKEDIRLDRPKPDDYMELAAQLQALQREEHRIRGELAIMTSYLAGKGLLDEYGIARRPSKEPAK